MNWKLAVVSMLVVFTVLNLAEGALAQTLKGVTISGPSPWIDVRSYGAKGDGTTDDTTAINNAIGDCPDNGCTVYFPSTTAEYYIHSGLTKHCDHWPGH